MESSVTREILWNVSDTSLITLYVSTSLAMMVTFLWFLRRMRRHRSTGRKKASDGSAYQFLDYIISHRMIRRDPYAGLMHLFLFWGFFILLIATTLIGIQHHLGVVFLYGTTFIIFSLTADFGGLIFCTGIVMALLRRQGKNYSTRLKKDNFTVFVLYLLLIIGITGFLLEGLRITRNFHSFELASPVGYLFALAFKAVGISAEESPLIHRFMWNFHAILVVVFFLILPYSIMKHIILASLQIFQSSFKAGRLSPATGPYLGRISMDQFSRADLLQADACLTCGRCNEVCPAHMAGKPLRPREIIADLRHNIDSGSLPADLPDQDALWSCTTCHACDEVCPVHIQIMDKIVHFRRGLVAQGDVPAIAARALESSETFTNPYGQPNSSRMEWARGLSVEVVKEDERHIELLYWVGCAGAFDPDGKEISRSMTAIFKHLGVSFKVLGCREKCTGDPLRRLGEEGLWQDLQSSNKEIIRYHGVKTIITHCPHCFNSLRHEYDFGPEAPQVLHHSEWLAKMLEKGLLKTEKSESGPVTYHDPCYLARSNGLTEEPRKLIDAVTPDGSRLEMKQHGKNSLCCGGGGGQIWLDVKGSQRIENLRAQQVDATGARTAVTGCPYCKTMLTAGSGNGSWNVKDIAQMISENLSVREIQK